MSDRPEPGAHINVVGAGPAGALIALLLARRGFLVDVYERRADPRGASPERGRSINLALAARGIRALEQAGVMAAITPLLVPMRGRRIHERDGSTAFLPYGQQADEVIHSVSRTLLTRGLIEAAAGDPRITLHFRTACRGVRLDGDATAAAGLEGNSAADPDGVVCQHADNLRTRVATTGPGAGQLLLHDAASGRDLEVPLAPTIAADGAGSAVRMSLAQGHRLRAREALLDHDYRELVIPAQAGRYALEREALHIWPRGGFMLIALPNADGSFTATLFLAREGSPSFASLRDDASVREFFTREFPDVPALMPDLLEEFHSHPQGRLGTVYADPWQVGGEVLLLGDAAHAIVPFHGQGMNCAFEDCIVLDALLGKASSFGAAFAAFARERRPNTDAIAAMALENYVEMRDSVRDPKFVRQQALAQELARRFPERFIPRYSMVMFRPDIPYAEALRRGAIQQALLDELDAARDAAGSRTAGVRPASGVPDLLALVESRLPPLAPAPGSVGIPGAAES